MRFIMWIHAIISIFVIQDTVNFVDGVIFVNLFYQFYNRNFIRQMLQFFEFHNYINQSRNLINAL